MHAMTPVALRDAAPEPLNPESRFCRRTNACVEARAEEGRGHAHADHARDVGPRGPQAVLARVRVRARDCGVLTRGARRLSSI